MILGVLGATRDVFIIVWALLTIIAIVFLIFAIFSIWRGVKELLNTFKTIANEDVKPILAISKDSANNVAGTTRFLGDTVARPVIKGLGFIAGARRAISVFTGVTGRRRKI